METIIQAIFRPEIIAPMMIFGIPIAAIVGNYWYKAKELEAGKKGFSEEERKLLLHAIHKNEELQQRLAEMEASLKQIAQQSLNKDKNKDS